MREITERQQVVLDAIRAHIRKYGSPPTRTEIARELGMANASSVRGHLEALQRTGRIEFQRDKYRGIRVIGDDVPLIRPLAEVAAGTPMVCEEHIIQRVPAMVAEQFWPRPDYLLTVRGDSMDKAGLRDRDVVAIRRTKTPKSDEVVVARFGDEVTLKRFVRIDDRHVELRPESYNPAHEVMELDLAKHILEIEGVAVGALIRDLGGAKTESSQAEQPERPVRLKTKSKL